MTSSSEAPYPQPPAGGPTRRAVVGTAVLGGVAAVATPSSATATRARPARRPLSPDELRPGRPLLLRGGTVVTVDPAVGVLPRADVLVRRGRIEAVGPRLRPPHDAVVLDVTGDLVLPGFVDTHRHMWQTALRGLGAEWTLTDYLSWMFGRLGPLFTPEDTYAGGLLGALEAIDSGVTTVVDWSHNMRTPEHADAALDALMDSGVRGRLAYGDYARPPQEWVLGGDVERLAERVPTSGARVTLQLAMDVAGDPAFPERPAWEFARDRGIPVTTHAGVWGYNPDVPPRLLRRYGLLLATTTYVHAATMSDASYELIADSGGSVSVAAESEMHGGQGYPPTAALRRHGITTSLSVDTVVWMSGDLFAAMRATLGADRALAHLRAHAQGETLTSNALRTEDVLAHATLDGARAMGEAGAIGSITPGKRADLVVLDTTTASMSPLVDPVAAAVLQAGRAEVDTVLVDGRVLKHRGRFVDGRLQRARRLADASRDRLLAGLGPRALREALDPRRPD